MENMELKRPESMKKVEYRLMGERFEDDLYDAIEMDSFLSQVADEIKRAMQLRKSGEDMDQWAEFNAKADAIEEKVIKKLRGE